MTTEYAGSLFDTPHAATRAAVYDFLTACGGETVESAVEALEDDLDAIVEEALSQGWEFPNTDNTEQEVRELFLDFLHENGSNEEAA